MECSIVANSRPVNESPGGGLPQSVYACEVDEISRGRIEVLIEVFNLVSLR